MAELMIDGITLRFSESAFTAAQWEQVASWVLNNGGITVEEHAKIAVEKAGEAVKSATAAAASAKEAKESAEKLDAAVESASSSARQAAVEKSEAIIARVAAEGRASAAADSAAAANKSAVEAKEAANAARGVDVIAAPGQLVVVRAVDAEGRPTKWSSMDRYIYEDVVEGGVVFPETAVTFFQSIGALSGGDAAQIVAGRSYRILWGNTTYTCTAFMIEDDVLAGLALGNPYLLGVGEDTRHPFCFSDFSGSSCSVTKKSSVSETINIQIEALPGVELQRLPSKFLPDDAEFITLVSPDGTKFRVSVDNSGNLSAAPV